MRRDPGESWTDDDPQFPERVRVLAQRLAYGYGNELPTDSDPLDVAAAKLWLEYTAGMVG
jgi:hypothetical protein